MIGWTASGDEVIVARTAGTMDVVPSSVDLLRVSPSSGSESIVTLQDIHVDTLTLSLDGKAIAFTGRRNDKDDVWTIPTTGGEARRLTNNGNTRIFYANLAWSPDGKVVYFDKQEQVNTISMFENFR
jgi:Tol biopolymer transport system component